MLTLVLGVIFGLKPNAPFASYMGSTEYPTKLSSLMNGCGNFFLYNPKPGEQYSVVTPEIQATMSNQTIPTGLTVVPVYGYLAPEGLDGRNIRFHETEEPNQPYPMTTLLRTMYNYDTLIIWYTADLPATDIQDIRRYVQNTPNTMALLWVYGENLPLGRDVAFSKWGVSQSCSFFTPEVMENFTEFTDNHYVERELIPPVAKFIPNTTILPPLLPENYKTGNNNSPD